MGQSCTAHSEQRFHFPLCLNQSPHRRKTHDRQSLPYLQLHCTGMHIIQRETHRTEVTEDNPLWEKQGWGPVLNLPLAVLDEPPGQILLGGLSSVELWEDLSGWLTTSAPLIQAARVPIESTCHRLKSNAGWQWHCGVVFIWYSLYFGAILRKFWGRTVWVFTFVCQVTDFLIES